MVSNYQLIVEVDRSRTGGVFTNHDEVKGHVKLKVGSEITLESIIVKLEGISETMLIIRVPRNRRDRHKTEKKILTCKHTLLYDTTIVFPPKNVRDVAKSSKFTLIPGEYSYPFEFKIPLKNSCYKDGISGKTYVSTIDLLEGTSTNPTHVAEVLPPSLGGLDSFAKINYFVKVTAKRANLFKLNLRSYDPFLYLPLNPSNFKNRDADGFEYFVRNKFVIPNKLPEIVACYATPSSSQVVSYQNQLPAKKSQTSRSDSPQQNGNTSGGFFLLLFGGSQAPRKSTVLKPQSAPTTPPKEQRPPPRNVYKPEVKPINLPLYLELRFDYPPYLIPTKTPSFKMYFCTDKDKKFYELPNGESSGLGKLFIRHMKIVLVEATVVTIENHSQTYTRTIELMDKALNVKVDLFTVERSTTRPNLYELEIPRDVYKEAIVPDTVIPSFRSCNIVRSYRLHIESKVCSEKKATKEDPLVEVSMFKNVSIYSGLENDHINPGLVYGSGGITRQRPALPPGEIAPPYEANTHETEGLPSYDEAFK